jgi:integrase
MQTVEKKGKTWQTTRLQNLVRHRSGRYYARAFAGGKEVWKSLRTDLFSVAQARLADFLREHRQRVASGKIADASSAKLTFADALLIHQRNQAVNPDTKPATLRYWNQIFAALLKSWPGLAEREVRRITISDCEQWAREFRKAASPTRWNNTLAGLRHVFDVAIRAGIIHRNPAALSDDPNSPLKRRRPNKKAPTLPTRAQFFQLVEAVESAGAGCSRHCADFLRGLAFTGVRKSEAAQIEWRDLDFEAGEIVVRGDPQTATKNWDIRRVPMIADARALFEKMRSARADEPLTEKVFKVRESQRAIDSACNKIGIARITHHDLRHLFATTCIESGIDIPTVAKWLGHKDGGKLALDTYGHLRREHSLAQAKRVSFSAAPPANNIVALLGA